MKKLYIHEIISSLGKFDRIIVTGPPRSGTTIGGLIIAHKLRYLYVDETFYDGNNENKFLGYLSRKNVVIQTTAFLKDLHKALYMVPTVLMVRSTKEILESFNNTKKFKNKYENIMNRISVKEMEILRNHYGSIDANKSLPDAIYDYFYRYSHSFRYLFGLDFNELKNHKFFIEKEERRKKFKNIKQVSLDADLVINLKKEMENDRAINW